MGLFVRHSAKGMLALAMALAVALTGAALFASVQSAVADERTLLVEDGATVNEAYLGSKGLTEEDTFHVVLQGSAVFDNVSISSKEASAVLVTDPHTKIHIKGATSFVGAENHAGIEVPKGKKVLIKGKKAGATLIAVGNGGFDYKTKAQAAACKSSCGAGIGGTKSNPACGDITIKNIDGKLSVRGCGIGAAGIGAISAMAGDILIASSNLQGVYGGCQLSAKDEAVLDGGPAVGGGSSPEEGGNIVFDACSGGDVIGGSNTLTVGLGNVKVKDGSVAFGADGNEDVESNNLFSIDDEETALAAAPGASVGDEVPGGVQSGTPEPPIVGAPGASDSGASTPDVPAPGATAPNASAPDASAPGAPAPDASTPDVSDDSADEDELAAVHSKDGEAKVTIGFAAVLLIAAAAAVAAVVAYMRSKKKRLAQ